MKISCDACKAKYSVSDDKVQGKVFKIRCKRCSHIVIVTGVASATTDAKDACDAPWHLAIDGEQVGPLTAAQVEERITSGEIDAETLGWREGFADWSALADIDAFAASVKPATVRHDPVSAVIAATAAPDVASSETGGQRLRGERNESSVLFSLGNLAQVAQTVQSPRRVPAATPPNATPTTEGSGLIDVRSLATAYLGNERATKSSVSSSNIGSFTDLPTFATNAFAEPTVLVPSKRSPRDRKLVIGVISALSLLAIATGVLLVMLLGRSSRDVASVPVPPARTSEPAVTKTPDVVAATPVTDPTTPTTPTTPPTTTTTPEKKVDKKTPTQPTTAARPSPTPSRPPTPATPPALTPTPVAATDQCEEVQCVLDGYPGACCAKYRHSPAPTPTPNPTPTPTNAPDSLDRTMISTGIDTVKARVMACGNKSPAKGKVTVKVFVAANGTVKSVNVEETPDPALGACVASNVQKAAFGATKTGGSFRMPFTF